MTKNNKQKRKGLLFRVIKALIKMCYRKRKVIGIKNIPKKPCIIVGNHSQLHGPIYAECYYPYKKKTWCIGNMMHLKDFPPYAYSDFSSFKPKWTHPFYKVMSYILAPLGTYLFKNADTIGVYKDARGISTFKKSVQALKDNNHIIIFPEHYQEYNNIINEFQDKFVDLAKLYYKDTNVEINFVPMYIAPNLKTVCYGKPIKYNASLPIEEQRKIICDYLKEQITELATNLPIHTVVPYANISKKKYPKSKQEQSKQ